MAKITDFDGKIKIEGCISYRLYDQIIIRSKPENVYNPQTEKQNSNRFPFGFRTKFASKNLWNLIHPYWNPALKKQAKSGFNLFIGMNKKAFIKGKLSYKDFILIPENGLNKSTFKYNRYDDHVMLSWDYFTNGRRVTDIDELHLIRLSNDNSIEITNLHIQRKEKYLNLEINFINIQHYYAFWKRGDRWSESVYLFLNS